MSKKKYTLVSGNASDKKNLHPGNHKIIFFLIDFPEIFSFLFSFYSFFWFFFCLFVCLFFCLYVIIYIYIYIYICIYIYIYIYVIYMRASKWKRMFTRPISGNKNTFFGLVYPFFASFFEPWYVNILHWAHDVKFNSTITITIIWNEQMIFMRNSNRQ